MEANVQEKWRHIDSLMSVGDIQCIVRKMILEQDAGELDIYLKLGWADDRWVWVDITVSNHSRTCHEIRAMTELICLHATDLLKSGERSLRDIVHYWRGTNFEPSGKCEQFVTEHDPDGIVTSPLDMAAKTIDKHIGAWEEKMRADGDDRSRN